MMNYCVYQKTREPPPLFWYFLSHITHCFTTTWNPASSYSSFSTRLSVP